MADPYLERLQCLECGYVLCELTEHEGRTSIAMATEDATEVIVFRAVIRCPHCWAKRKFFSVPIRHYWQIGSEIIEKDGG